MHKHQTSPIYPYVLCAFIYYAYYYSLSGESIECCSLFKKLNYLLAPAIVSQHFSLENVNTQREY